MAANMKVAQRIESPSNPSHPQRATVGTSRPTFRRHAASPSGRLFDADTPIILAGI